MVMERDGGVGLGGGWWVVVPYEVCACFGLVGILPQFTSAVTSRGEIYLAVTSHLNLPQFTSVYLSLPQFTSLSPHTAHLHLGEVNEVIQRISIRKDTRKFFCDIQK